MICKRQKSIISNCTLLFFEEAKKLIETLTKKEKIEKTVDFKSKYIPIEQTNLEKFLREIQRESFLNKIVFNNSLALINFHCRSFLIRDSSINRMKSARSEHKSHTMSNFHFHKTLYFKDRRNS